MLQDLRQQILLILV